MSKEAKDALILPQLKSASLISIGQLCNDDCTVFLNKEQLLAIKNNKIVLKGIRNHHDGLWDIPIQKSTISVKNCIVPTIHPGLYKSRVYISRIVNRRKKRNKNTNLLHNSIPKKEVEVTTLNTLIKNAKQ